MLLMKRLACYKEEAPGSFIVYNLIHMNRKLCYIYYIESTFLNGVAIYIQTGNIIVII